jgi:hypothetical protein
MGSAAFRRRRRVLASPLIRIHSSRGRATADGQMLFLANMLSKMKRSTALGSRIAEVHNGSSLFTGDAGQGESDIRHSEALPRPGADVISRGARCTSRGTLPLRRRISAPAATSPRLKRCNEAGR